MGLVKLDKLDDIVTLVIFKNPPVNTLSNKLLDDLRNSISDLIRNDAVKAIVLLGDGGKFSGGAEVAFIANQSHEKVLQYVNKANEIISLIEQSNKPIVAAIDGYALGGGLELAMGCHARVSTETTKFSLPEVNLGLLPVFGGTQRLPRLIGLQKAIEIMLIPKHIDGREAKKLGLVDDTVMKSSDLISRATEIAISLTNNISQLRRSIDLTDKLPEETSFKVMLSAAREMIRKRASNVMHPFSCLNAIETGVLQGGLAGLAKEKEEFATLIRLPAAESLMHIFFASRQTSKVPGVTDGDLMPRKITRVAVLGGGTMGSGICTSLILNGIECIIKDIKQEYLDTALAKIKDNIKRRVKSRKMKQDQADKCLQLVKTQLDYSNFDKVDIVIEAVIEDVALKQRIFSDLERICKPNTILATNTSTINLDLISKKTNCKSRIIGTHFFSPAHVMNLLEIVITPQVSKQVIIDSLYLSKLLNKIPIVSGNCVGFTVNRTFFPYLQVATFLVDSGIDLYRIDNALEDFGMPMGCFRMVDLSGIDVMYKVGQIISEAYKDRTYKSPLVELMIKANRLGQKSKIGFYKYEGIVPSVDPSMKLIVQESRRLARRPQIFEVSDAEIIEMIMYAIANEAFRVVEEGIVIRDSDIDVASVYGYGFPPYRGGILKFAKLEGHNRVYTKLNYLFNTYGLNVFKPCNYLKLLAYRSSKF